MARLRRSEVDRRQHRRRQLFAAGDGGSTAPAFPDAPSVLVLLNNGTLLDISGDVRFESGLTVRRGRAANDARVRAGNGTMKINNLDGKYSPRNPTSPLYGLIGRGTQVVIARHGTRRMWGEIPEWPSEWTTGGQDAWVSMVVAGPLRRLLAPNAPVLASALTRSSVAALPAALWTLEDGSAATLATPYDPANAVLLPTGSVSFGGVSDLPGATTAVSLATAGSYLSGAAPTIIGPWGFEFAAKSAVSTFNRMFRIVDTTGNTYALFPPDGTVFPMQVEIVGPGTITDTTATYDFGSPAATGFTDVWHYYGVYFAQHGSSVKASLYVDGVLRGTGDSSGGVTLASPLSFQVSQNDVLFPSTDGTLHGVSHLQFFSGTVQSNVYKALSGYTGETAGRRIQRLLGENGVGFVAVGDLDDTMPMGPQASERLVDLIYDCETADNGYLGEDRNSFSLTYSTGASMLNQPATLQLNYADSGNLTLPLKPSDNDQRIVNDSDVVLASGGGHYRYALTSGPMSTASPGSGGIGPYPENPTVNAATVANAADVAGTRVNVGTVDLQRFDQVNVNVANTVTNHGLAALAGQMVGVDTGGRISIDNPPVWTQRDQINLIVVGEYEVFDQFRYTIAYDTVLQEPYQVGILDDPVLGRLESDGTTVVGAHSSAETQFLALTATGELWQTTDRQADDFPFDILVSGERMTVTGIGIAAQDNFLRVASNGWGTSDSGQAWANSGGSPSDFSVNGTQGVINLSTTVTPRLSQLPIGIGPSIDVYVDWLHIPTAPTGAGNVTLTLDACRVDANNYVGLQLFAAAGGSMSCSVVQVTNGGVVAQDGAFPAVGANTTVYSALLRISPSLLQGWVWQRGTGMPTSPLTSVATATSPVAGDLLWQAEIAAGITNVPPFYVEFTGVTFTGTSNPQPWNVVRSVNGVVKAIPAGAAIAVRNPFRLAA